LTGSTDVVSGWKERQKSFEQCPDPRFRAVRTEVRDPKALLSRSGDVARQGRQVRRGRSLVGGSRGAGGRWVIVQMHASVPADRVRGMTLKEKEAPA